MFTFSQTVEHMALKKKKKKQDLQALLEETVHWALEDQVAPLDRLVLALHGDQ